MGRSVSTPMANTTQSMTRCDNLQTRCPARPVSNRACSITAGEITLLRPASRSTTVSASGVGSKQLPCRAIIIASLKLLKLRFFDVCGLKGGLPPFCGFGQNSGEEADHSPTAEEGASRADHAGCTPTVQVV